MENDNSDNAVLRTLKQLGIHYANIDNIGYSVLYDSLYLLYLPVEHDPNLIRIAAPKICEAYVNTETSHIVNEMNLSVKYINFSVLGNAVWAIYEHHLFDEDNLSEVIPHMLMQLRTATKTFQERIISRVNMVEL